MYWETLTLYKITSGLEVNEVPLNSLPATICGLTMPSFCLIIAFAMYSSYSNDNSGLYVPSFTFYIISYCLSFCSFVSSAGTNFNASIYLYYLFFKNLKIQFSFKRGFGVLGFWGFAFCWCCCCLWLLMFSLCCFCCRWCCWVVGVVWCVVVFVDS